MAELQQAKRHEAFDVIQATAKPRLDQELDKTDSCVSTEARQDQNRAGADPDSASPAILPQRRRMAALQIKDVPPEFIARLKMAALQQDKTLRQFVIDSLTNATLPPVVVGGTEPKASSRKR